MAQVYHPISTKFILNGCPPVQWAGGQVCEYPKVGGPPGCPASFRDITICDAGAKLVLSSVRSSASPHLLSAVPF
eukprot:10669916-Karenia_brevis.AAC.1